MKLSAVEITTTVGSLVIKTRVEFAKGWGSDDPEEIVEMIRRVRDEHNAKDKEERA